jgi:SAM-dependent MidA family methyltransferase
VPEGPAIIVANEFLDALPIRQRVHADGAWNERLVALDAHGALAFAAGATVDPANLALDSTPAKLTPDTIVELRPGEECLLAQLAARSRPFVALFIDYGPATAAVGDTLQAVRRHEYANPLADPGTVDLTGARAVSRAWPARRGPAGLAVDGPMTQAGFPGPARHRERAARLMVANPGKAAEIEAGVQRLIAPTGMGQLFKVLAVRSRTLPPPLRSARRRHARADHRTRPGRISRHPARFFHPPRAASRRASTHP